MANRGVSTRYKVGDLSTHNLPGLDAICDEFENRRKPVVSNVLEMAFRTRYSAAEGFERLRTHPSASTREQAKVAAIDEYTPKIFSQLDAIETMVGSCLSSKVVDRRVSSGGAPQFVFLCESRVGRGSSSNGWICPFTDHSGKTRFFKCGGESAFIAELSINRGRPEYVYRPLLSVEAFHHALNRLKNAVTLRRDTQEGEAFSNPVLDVVHQTLKDGLTRAEYKAASQDLNLGEKERTSPFSLRGKDDFECTIAFDGSRVQTLVTVGLNRRTRILSASIREGVDTLEL